jgi:hypothetical protein
MVADHHSLLTETDIEEVAYFTGLTRESHKGTELSRISSAQTEVPRGILAKCSRDGFLGG